jgi:hypothetical protein
MFGTAGGSFSVGIAESLRCICRPSLIPGLPVVVHEYSTLRVDRRGTYRFYFCFSGAAKNVDCWDSGTSGICFLCRDGLPRIAWLSTPVKTARQPNPRSALDAGATPCFHVEDHRPSASESDRYAL